MPRGFQCILVAASGLALISAAPKSSGEVSGNQSANQTAANEQLNRIATAVEKLPQRQVPDSGCDAGHDERRSDLCAQWKAADAANDSAWWTGAAFYATLAGLVIGAATFGAAALAASFAKRAADETKRSADLAQLSIVDTRRTAETQMRPWIQIKSASFAKIGPLAPDRHLLVLNVTLKVVNHGSTTAQLSIVSKLFVEHRPFLRSENIRDLFDEDHFLNSEQHVIFPNSDIDITMQVKGPWPPEAPAAAPELAVLIDYGGNGYSGYVTGRIFEVCRFGTTAFHATGVGRDELDKIKLIALERASLSLTK